MYALICFFFFAYLCFFAYLDLRCTTCDDVLEAIEKIKNNNPHANINPNTNKEGIILPMDQSSSFTTVDYADNAVKQNKASLDCLLRNATEGHYIKYLLQSSGKKYITTDWTLDLCVFEAIINSLYSTLAGDEFMVKKLHKVRPKKSNAHLHTGK